MAVCILFLKKLATQVQTTHIALRQKQGNVNSCKGNWLSHTVSLPDSSVPCQSLALCQIRPHTATWTRFTSARRVGTVP